MTLVYIGAASADIATGRIIQRVAAGGALIPPGEVDRRYHHSMSNLPTAWQIVDRAFILDNSGQRYRLLLSIEYGRARYLSQNLPPWAQDALPPELLRRHDLDR